jgi:hypothetical protein
MRIGIGIGLQFNKSAGGGIAQDFQNRVLADGGTFEAMACLNSTISFLQSIDL